MACDHQIIPRHNVGLGWSNPEVEDALQGEAHKLCGMLPHELSNLPLHFLHEGKLA